MPYRKNEGLAKSSDCCIYIAGTLTLDELEDVKTAVSEAVTNAIIHGYREQGGRVVMRAHLTEENELSVEIIDRGGGHCRRSTGNAAPLYLPLRKMSVLAWDFPLWRPL